MATTTSNAAVVKGSYWAFVLDEASRNKLLAAFPPKFPDVIAHHVTVGFGKTCPAGFTAGETQSIDVIWHAEDASLECVVVRAGSLHRPDGKPFHITMSLDRAAGRKPVQSNDVIEKVMMTPVLPMIKVTGTLQFC